MIKNVDLYCNLLLSHTFARNRAQAMGKPVSSSLRHWSLCLCQICQLNGTPVASYDARAMFMLISEPHCEVSMIVNYEYWIWYNPLSHTDALTLIFIARMVESTWCAIRSVFFCTRSSRWPLSQTVREPSRVVLCISTLYSSLIVLCVITNLLEE